jgi:hypothetical protein
MGMSRRHRRKSEVVTDLADGGRVSAFGYGCADEPQGLSLAVGECLHGRTTVQVWQ